MSTWLAENPEMLQAALDIVDTWDQGSILSEAARLATAVFSDSGDDGDRSACSSSSSSSDVGSPTRLPPLAVKPSKVEARGARRLKPSTMMSTHHRRREEIKSLQRMSEELERQLKSMHKISFVRGKTEDESSLWRDVARRQQNLRSQAEAKQLSLRRRVDAQMNMGRGLVRLMEKARAMENDHTVQIIRPRGVRAVGTLDIKTDQICRIDKVYENIDAVFTSPHFHDGTLQFLDIQLRDDQPGQFVIELSQIWTTPFAVDRMMDALWKLCYIRQQEKWCGPEFVQDSKTRVDDSMLVTKFNAVATIASAVGYFNGRVVIKRFLATDASPPAIISDFYCAPNRTSPGAFAGVQSQEHSCLRVLPAMRASTHGKGPVWQGSQVQFSQRATIAFAESDSTGRHSAELFTKLMLDKLRDSVDIMHNTVESMLLTSR